MDIATVRDFVISILGCLYIILTIGIIVGLIFVYFKVRNLLATVNRTVNRVRRWLAYVQGLVKGLNESVNVFKKGGI
jgi:hypothetical protein